MKLVTGLLLFAALATAQTVRAPLTIADLEKWMTELSNWGRWGKADELGTLNLITPAKRLQAARLVKEGFAVSMSHDAEKEKGPDNPRPFVHEMLSTSATPNSSSHSDSFTIAHHGLAHTHLDALCHFFYKGKMYNGFSREEVTEKGAGKLSVYQARKGIFTRAVLMDIPQLKGVPYLDPGTAIYPADLEAWEKKSGSRVEPGDVVLIRTGRWARRAEKGAWPPAQLAGLDVSCVRWLKARDAAVLGSDAASDVRPSGVEGFAQPVHTLTIVTLGTPILDNCDFEDVSRESLKRKRWSFLITTSPLAVPGATGSALNPIAVF